MCQLTIWKGREASLRVTVFATPMEAKFQLKATVITSARRGGEATARAPRKRNGCDTGLEQV